MKKRYTVFVSSTYKDLKDERNAAIHQILKLHHIPIGMEYFTAGKPSIEIIKKDIKECDIYLLISGYEYGSIVKDDNMSYTEYEYRYALKNNKIVFSLVAKDNKLVEISEKQLNFRKLICENQCAFYCNEEQLKEELSVNLSKIIQENKQCLLGHISLGEINNTMSLKQFLFNHDSKIYRAYNDIMKPVVQDKNKGTILFIETDVSNLLIHEFNKKNICANDIEKNFLDSFFRLSFKNIHNSLDKINQLQSNIEIATKENIKGNPDNLMKVLYRNEKDKNLIANYVSDILECHAKIENMYRDTLVEIDYFKERID